VAVNRALVWSPMRRVVLSVLAMVALAVVVGIGLAQAGGDATESAAGTPAFDLAAAQRQLAGAPAPLAALHRDASRLLGGGQTAFDARVRSVRGHPVVINKWAAWCGPCQLEFPFLQRQATARGKDVAFLGIDAKDNRAEATTFLRDMPVPVPSDEDPDERIARAYAKGAFFPTTVFLDERGETAYIHQGQYRSERDLAEDIDRYLLR
jgi:cytochrome c biogenesis protein CcmG, thiol:disulfide interchange protein DsbE